jgi:hypothetical protein
MTSSVRFVDRLQSAFTEMSEQESCGELATHPAFVFESY